MSYSEKSSSPDFPEVEHGDAGQRDDFPEDSLNHFVLQVEGGKLHAHSVILRLHSPFLRTLIDARRSDDEVVDLDSSRNGSQDVTYDAVVAFLFQLYPVHSLMPIAHDVMLKSLFPLAIYFQSQHVLNKCEKYIDQNLSRSGLDLNVNAALLYLRLSGMQGDNNAGRQKHLLGVLALKTMAQILSSEDFGESDPILQRMVLRGRALHMEKRLQAVQEMGMDLFGTRLPEVELVCTSCSKPSFRSSIVCTDCYNKFMDMLLNVT